MGFLQAICDLGALSQGSGLDSYLSFPLERGGRLIRVALQAVDPQAGLLDVQGVARVDLAGHSTEPGMKRKYLFRSRAGSNAAWGFSPIHRIGRPKQDAALGREQFFGKGGDWRGDADSHLHKIRHRLLLDYEREHIFTPGSVNRIMADLPPMLERVLAGLDPRAPYAVIFGIDQSGVFLFPGEIPAFVDYFRRKLERTLRKKAGRQRSGSARSGVHANPGARTRPGAEQFTCVLCRQDCRPITLSKVFRFATHDKVNVLHGLDRSRGEASFPVCEPCFQRISAGRDRLQFELSNSSLLPHINIWMLPEAVGGSGLLPHLLGGVEQALPGNGSQSDDSQGGGRRREAGFFTCLARRGRGLVFHFLFWENNRAQEQVRLMVEGVPPERLILLERTWGEVMAAVFGKTRRELLTIDWAIRSLYVTLSRFAGRGEGGNKKGYKPVIRDFTLKVAGKMLQGERLPVAALKEAVVTRAARLAHEASTWGDVGKGLKYAQAWVDYMNRINEVISCS